jgi:tetratricopeptide (TPR) repeat protein
LPLVSSFSGKLVARHFGTLQQKRHISDIGVLFAAATGRVLPFDISSRIFTHSANRGRGTKVSVTARVVAGAIALAAVTSFANAQLSPQWQTCTGNPGIDWDQQITSCTALIQSGAEAKENVAIAFYNRALAYENKEDYERAIADYSEAIRLNPNDADAYFYRSLDRKRKGDNAGAEADMAAAKRINPNIGE